MADFFFLTITEVYYLRPADMIEQMAVFNLEEFKYIIQPCRNCADVSTLVVTVKVIGP